MGFVREEARGKGGSRYLYYCFYDSRQGTLRRKYLGKASDPEAQRRGRVLQWLGKLDKKEVQRLRHEAEASEKLGLPFDVSLERVLELREALSAKSRE